MRPEAPIPLPEPVYATAVCPSCGTALDPLPKAKKKCRACGEAIYVRSGPDGRRYLLSEGQLGAHEEWWHRHRRAQEWVERTEGLLEPDELRQLQDEMTERDPRYSPRDFYWAAANRRLLHLLKGSDWHAVQMHYFGMARAAYDEAEERGTAPVGAMDERTAVLMREANLASLRGYAQWMTHVSILRGDCCPPCRRERVGRVALEKEFAAPRLPHVDCREGWCLCIYAPAM